MNGKTVVTTFAGRGGSSIGYETANCRVLLALDFEKKAVETYKMNFPNTTVWQKNIREVTGKQILSEIGLKAGQLDIFDGSPPCTPFSTAGKREAGWGKKYKHGSESQAEISDDLFFEYLRLVKEIKPKCFIAENVRGLIFGTAKGYYNQILRKMKSTGYRVLVFDLNARYFEVPQSRPRIVFIGIRKDLKISKPIPSLKTHKEITFEECTKNLKIPKKEIDAAIKVCKRPSVKNYLKYCRPGQTFSEYHVKGNQFGWMRIKNNQPCPTIMANSFQKMFHPTEERALTVSEAKRCSTFPDDYKFLSDDDGWLGIGNSVPPRLIYHIVKYVNLLVRN